MRVQKRVQLPTMPRSNDQKMKENVGQWGSFGALLTDSSKAFDCLPHDLLIANLHAYGFVLKSIKLMDSYLRNRKQRVIVVGKRSFLVFLNAQF